MKLTEENRKWWILGALTSAIAMVSIDQTVLPVALPTIQRELHVTELGLQWLINAYLLTLTALVIAGGRIADIFGPRRIFCAGLLAFSLASALCGMSFSEGWFIGARALQGVGGALLLPSTTSILLSTFPVEERGKALGLFLSLGSIFLAMGPVIGGLCTQYLSWRYVFWINLPIAAIGFIAVMMIIPKSEKKQDTFDLLGFFTLSLGMISLIIALMEGPKWGWFSPMTVGLFLLGVLLIACLVIFDRKVEHPFIEFSIFRSKPYVGGNLCIFCLQFMLMISVFWVIYFQNILGYSPAAAGGIAMISNAPLILSAPIAGRLNDRFGPRIPVVLGFVLIVLSLAWFLLIASKATLLLLLPTLILIGLAVPLVFTPGFAAAMSQIPAKKRGVASGTMSTLRQFGATLGMAVIGALFLNVQEKHFAKSLLENESTKSLDPSLFDGLLSSAPSAVSALKALPSNAAQLIETSYFAAYEMAFSSINLLSMIIGLLGLIVAIIFLKKMPHLEETEK